MLQTHEEVNASSMGSLKRECAVQPPGSCNAAMPVDATIKTSLPSPRNHLDAKHFFVKVLPVPAGASIMYG